MISSETESPWHNALSSATIHRIAFEGATVRSSLLAARLSNLIVLASLLPLTGSAQQPAAPAPSLQDILVHLQENVWDYLANVPNFFCDEHVASNLQQEGRHDIRTTTESVFRLVRSKAIGEAHTFTESREVKTINKKAAKGDQIHGPAIFSGGFSTSAGVVSLEMSRCYDYTLQPPGLLNNKTPAIIIDYAMNPDMLTDDSCPGPEKQSGRAWIDPATFHTLRVEMAVPSHKDNNGERVYWTWSVDFAPVSFDNKQFWMPATITSKAIANNASGVWSFTANYSNYHKLTVNSRIITDVGDNPPAPPQ